MTRSEATLTDCMRRMAHARSAHVTIVAVPVAKERGGFVDADGAIHPIGDVAIVGRDPALAQLAILHDSVSRRHAEVTRDGEGRFVLRDLGATNGIFVEGRRVDTIELRDRQMVSFGSVSLVFLNARPKRPSLALDRAASPDDYLRVVTVSTTEARLEYRHASAPLRDQPLLLVQHLAARWTRDELVPEALRGFARSNELAPVLDAGGMGASSSLRLLAGTLRRLLASLGAEHLLEMNDRLGYRLRAALADEGGER